MAGIYATTLEALLELWDGEATLNTVAVQEIHPRDVADLIGSGNDLEAVWLGDATISRDIPTMRAGVVEFEEVWTIDLIVQVVKVGTPAGVIDRAADIHRALIKPLQADAYAGLTAPGWRRFEVVAGESATVSHGVWRADHYGVRIEDTLTVTARIDSTSN